MASLLLDPRHGDEVHVPVPGPLEGVKSRTKAILQAKNITFTYPTYRDRVLYLLRRPIGATAAARFQSQGYVFEHVRSLVRRRRVAAA